MIAFTESDLEYLSAWQPLGTFPDGRNPVRDYINPALQLVKKDTETSLQVGSDGGRSNYYSALLFREAHRQQLRVPCHFVYVSLLTPVAVIGLTSAYGCSTGHLAYSGLLFTDLISPAHDSVSSAVCSAFKDTPYQLLNPACVAPKLSDTIQPYEYCLSPEPWDRVFHVLFADSD